MSLFECSEDEEFEYVDSSDDSDDSYDDDDSDDDDKDTEEDEEEDDDTDSDSDDDSDEDDSDEYSIGAAVFISDTPAYNDCTDSGGNMTEIAITLAVQQVEGVVHIIYDRFDCDLFQDPLSA